jgi:hypothetical protein
MKKLRIIASTICAICLFALTTSGFAEMTLMTDAELDQITAQAGFSEVLGIMHVNHDSETGTYYFGGSGGYVSMANTSYQGTIGIDPSITTQIVDVNGATGYECQLNGPIVDITDFQTTVQLGRHLDSSNSLGALNIDRMVVNIHGTLRVTTK